MSEKQITKLAEESQRLPRHIAIIMDGNGRWAKNRGLPRSAGHSAGAESFRRAARHCRKRGVEYLTVYAFSTENWTRPAEEVSGIMRLLGTYLKEALEGMERENTRMRFFGDVSVLTPELRELCLECEQRSQKYTGGQVNICLNYGGRDEIVRAAQAFAADCTAGKVTPASLTEEGFSRYLWSAGVPDPDLVIRPSGEERISNFLLWQSAYAEFYFTDVSWPDFNREELRKALAAYQGRSRRYGGI